MCPNLALTEHEAWKFFVGGVRMASLVASYIRLQAHRCETQLISRLVTYFDIHWPQDGSRQWASLNFLHFLFVDV